MKMPKLKSPTPIRATALRGGYTSCLPPIRARPPVPKPPLATGKLPGGQPVVVTEFVPDDTGEWYEAQPGDEQCVAGAPPTLDFDNMSDAELLRLEPVAKLLKEHDWTYDFSDDGAVWRRGRAQREAIDRALAALPYREAAALWMMYAPAVCGGYRRA